MAYTLDKSDIILSFGKEVSTERQQMILNFFKIPINRMLESFISSTCAICCETFDTIDKQACLFSHIETNHMSPTMYYQELMNVVRKLASDDGPTTPTVELILGKLNDMNIDVKVTLEDAEYLIELSELALKDYNNDMSCF